MHRLLLCLPIPLAAAALVGCTTNVSASGEAADAEAASTSATAIVSVERSVSAGSSDASRAEAVARFVRMRAGAVDEEALRMVGAAADFPALGACASVPFAAPGRGPRALALVDVGAITVETPHARTSLVARQLPDVADLVSGVVYTARPGDVALPAHERYVIRAAGSPELDVAPFAVDATAPAEPADVRIAGQETSNGTVVLSSAGAAASAPIDVTWEAGAPDDFIYVDVAPSALGKSAAAPVARCLFADTGRGSIPATALGSLDEGSLAIHRLHREPFRVRGVDPGEVRFDFARVVSFQRR